jgi:hypothetical protein
MAEDAEPPRTPEETAAIIAELLGKEAPWTPEERAAIIAELRRKFPDKQLYPVQRGNLANEWENMANAALLRDAYCRDINSWVPPNLAALVAAVRRTQLTRFYPFTGHEWLHFADGPGVWDHFWDQSAPACIGNCPEGYVVVQGAVGYRAPGRQVIRTLTTHDPDEAAAEAERLLAGWAWSGQGS